MAKNLSDAEYIKALEKQNAKLSSLLAISEGQKDHLKKQLAELRDKFRENFIQS